MNKDILKGNWKQIRGEVKEWWGQLTDNEVNQIEGRWDRLSGLLQEKYGYNRREAEDEIRKFMDKMETRLERSL